MCNWNEGLPSDARALTAKGREVASSSNARHYDDSHCVRWAHRNHGRTDEGQGKPPDESPCAICGCTDGRHVVWKHKAHEKGLETPVTPAGDLPRYPCER